MPSEIARLFHQENREKKRTGSGVHSKTGKRGYVGKMLFPTDLMSRKEKYNHRKAGKVKVYKMNELILTKEEFEQHDESMQKMLLTRWRELYSNKEIMDSMQIRGNAAFHNLIQELGVPKKPRVGAGRPKKNAAAATKTKAAAKKEKVNSIIAAQVQAQQPQQQPQQAQQQVMVMEPQEVELIKTGLNLEYHGEYNAEQLSKIFTKLQLIIDGEENKFTIKISLRENEN